jgi:CRISPR-associated protein Csm3
MKLQGKIIVNCELEVLTGLAVGAGKETLEIGGLDTPVIKDAKGIPYLPGSSIKGKLRSLIERKSFDLTPLKEYRDKEARFEQELKVIEKAKGKNSPEYRRKQNERNKALEKEKNQLEEKDWRYIGGPFIHTCSDRDCNVCTIFGRPGEEKTAEPTRLYVRDASLNEEHFKEKFKELYENNLFTEAKFENAIDRLTSSANPRNFERVPAGAQFKCEFVFNIYDDEDKGRFRVFLETLQWLEDDYLGSSGSRGYGKIKFQSFKVFVKSTKDYEEAKLPEAIEAQDLEDLISKQKEIIEKIEVS